MGKQSVALGAIQSRPAGQRVEFVEKGAVFHRVLGVSERIRYRGIEPLAIVKRDADRGAKMRRIGTGERLGGRNRRQGPEIGIVRAIKDSGVEIVELRQPLGEDNGAGMLQAEFRLA